jgi:hypothetical protein
MSFMNEVQGKHGELESVVVHNTSSNIKHGNGYRTIIITSGTSTVRRHFDLELLFTFVNIMYIVPWNK